MKCSGLSVTCRAYTQTSRTIGKKNRRYTESLYPTDLSYSIGDIRLQSDTND